MVLSPFLFLSAIPLLFLSFPPVQSSEFLSTNSSSFLSEIAHALSEKERWDPESETKAKIKVSDLHETVSKIGVLSRYEFDAKIGKNMKLGFKFSDETVKWRRGGNGVVMVESDSDLVAGGDAGRVESVVKDLELTGPLQLRVGMEGSELDQISLNLPSINVTYTGLKQVLIPYGIKIRIIGAQEISFSHPNDIGLYLNGTFSTPNKAEIPILPPAFPSCTPLLSVNILGPILVIANKTLNPSSPIKLKFNSHRDTVELSPDKCYAKVREISSCLFCSVSSKLGLLDKVIRRFNGKIILDEKYISFVKAKIISFRVVKFRLSLEREVNKKDRVWRRTEGWKTKPRFENLTIEVLARVLKEGKLKVLTVKKVKREFNAVESTAWSSLMSNISFTQFNNIVLPPEALTLDVKW
ncbi:hypothetical protein LUZ60_010441 [Juncus effusus]|nr:hypothetical protein LUZ60_010441 [Juncus effusus]